MVCKITSQKSHEGFVVKRAGSQLFSEGKNSITYLSSLSFIFKVTILLNRRGVVSFEQLLLDISEALGFPRWHRARVTRLYTTHAREVSHSHINLQREPSGKNAMMGLLTTVTFCGVYNSLHVEMLPGLGS